MRGKLLEIITNAGFTDAVLVELTGYKTSKSTNGALVRALRPWIQPSIGISQEVVLIRMALT